MFDKIGKKLFTKLSNAIPALEQYSISGINFLYSLLLPLLMPLDDFGRFTYYLSIYYFFLSTWESMIVDPWILLKNNNHQGSAEGNTTPPFIAFSILLSATFMGVLSFFFTLPLWEFLSLGALTSISLWRVYSRRIRYQNGDYTFLFSISMVTIVLRLGLLYLFKDEINGHLALVIYFASDIPAIILDIPFVRLAIVNAFRHTKISYFVEQRTIISNLFYLQITTWLYPFTISSLTVALLSFQLNGLLKMIVNLTLPLKLLNKNLMHQFLKTFEGDVNDYRSSFAQYIKIATPYTLISLATIILLGPVYLLGSTDLSVMATCLLLALAALNIIAYTLTNGLKAGFSKSLKLSELSKLNTYVLPSGIVLFFILYFLKLEFTPLIAEMATPFIEAVFLATIFRKYFRPNTPLPKQSI